MDKLKRNDYLNPYIAQLVYIISKSSRKKIPYRKQSTKPHDVVDKFQFPYSPPVPRGLISRHSKSDVVSQNDWYRSLRDLFLD